MKTAFMTFCVTMLTVCVLLIVGLVSGYVRIASPDGFKQMAYTDNQRALMTALVSESGVE